ncbi:hypothetical protein L3V16_08535 [Brucella ciceri]|uniref:hypothetical protein n=1 Tax=Brucella ciceri TaxID=391287 RepID=UPI001F145EEA|nr:hypothetical protein [Brucella ciceri]MCH6203889.1 hypothetical protein [Brucella ciceri]
MAILQDDDEGLAEHAEPMVKAKELIAKLSALPFLPVQGAVNIDAIVQPLEDIHAPGGLCRWTDVATAIGEVRRSLSALEPSAPDMGNPITDKTVKMVLAEAIAQVWYQTHDCDVEEIDRIIAHLKRNGLIIVGRQRFRMMADAIQSAAAYLALSQPNSAEKLIAELDAAMNGETVRANQLSGISGQLIESLIKDADWLGEYGHQMHEESEYHDGGYTANRLQAIGDRISKLLETVIPVSDGVDSTEVGIPATEPSTARKLALEEGRLIELLRNAHRVLGGGGDEEFQETVALNVKYALEEYEAIRALSSPGHADDLAVDRFAIAMKQKLAKKREEGRGGWENKDECSAEYLSYLLIQHIWKGDPVDIANLAMMLHQRGERVVIDSETSFIIPDHADAGKLDAVAICKKLAPYLGATAANDWTGLKDDDAISMTVKMRVGDLRTLKAVATDEADAGKVEGDGWLPIESAPKDGTVILVYREDAGVFTAHYVEEDAHLSSPMNPPEGDFYWFSTSGDDLTNDMPTHWRPLPSAPSEGAE